MYQTLLNQPPRIKPIQSLDELAAWTPANQQVHAASVPLQSRPLSHSPHPKVLICHDMANGYKDDAFAQTVIRPSENTAENYSFQHFPLIDEFVYFSHHRISIPPKQWVNAAHRNGVIVYATLITEWEGAVVETLKLIYGPEYDATPIITPSDTSSESTRPIYPAAKVSTFYIEKLVQLALFYGFEGWFINIECDLGEPHHAAAMREFVHLLTLAMRASALPNAKVIWYDSLTIEGKLKWQDRVTPENKPFFDACDGIFVNYTWKQSYPEETAKLVSSASGVDRRKDVFFGIDVWGRNTFGGGGFNVHKALREITKHGLSTALFAQAWTYEFLGPSQFNKADMRLWRGEPHRMLSPDFPPYEDPEKPPYSTIEDPSDLGCVSDFILPRPSGTCESFYTDFDTGFGNAYFCDGVAVMESMYWFNLSRQSIPPSYISQRSLSLVTLSKFSDTDASIKLVEDVIPLPTTSVTTPYSRRVCTGVSWNGGSSLEINWRLPETTIPGNVSDLWTLIPIQPIGVVSSKNQSLVARIRFKSKSSSFSLGVVITIESLDDSRMKSHRICKVQTISEYDDDICGSWKVLELGVQECIDGLMLREDSFRVSHVGIVVANSWDGVLDDDDGIGKIWIGEVYVGPARDLIQPVAVRDFAFSWSGDLGKERHGKSETSWVTLGWKSQDPSLPAVERWELFLSGFWKGTVYFPQYEGYIGRDEDIRVLGFNAYGTLVIELEGKLDR